MKSFALTLALALCSSTALAQASPPPALEDYAYRPSEGDAPPRVDVEHDHRRYGTVFVFRGGIFSGTGVAKQECDGEACPSNLESTEYSEVPSYALSLDTLHHTSRDFRIGVGVGLVPKLAVQESGERYELGTAVSVDLVLEGVIDLSKKTALTLRGRVGLSVLDPSGELEDEASATSRACDEYESNTYGSCDAEQGPYLGAQIGAGAGLLVNLGGLGLRVDLEVQAQTLKTLGVDADGTESAVRFQGIRPMLLAGIEL
ncbi:MAG: hypothetical protein IT377_21530 [Polyangiaceae bacterium]|nr:hypothetical protein [Polyangiaceae bacterium]